MLSFYLSLIGSEEDRSFIEKLYEQYQSEMFGAAFSVLHSKSDAEDAVHNAFLRIIDNIEKIKSVNTESLGYYLAAICRNISINMLRRQNKRNEPVTENYDMAESPERIEDIIDSKLSAEKVMSYLHKLNRTDFETIYFWFVLGYSSAEIASALNISAGAARQRLYKAKKNLKTLITEAEKKDGK